MDIGHGDADHNSGDWGWMKSNAASLLTDFYLWECKYKFIPDVQSNFNEITKSAEE